MTGSFGGEAPIFDAAFRGSLRRLLLWRRDVRRFRKAPVDAGLLQEILEQACLAPSVGNSQPWRFVVVESAERRAAVLENFLACNAAALAEYKGSQARLYATLKLSGLQEAPIQLAIFCDTTTHRGYGLGRRSMPEALAHSVAMATHTLWLSARAHALGLGWISILDPEAVRNGLDLPSGWSLIAYLCIGYPEEEHVDPELERAGWQERARPESFILRR